MHFFNPIFILLALTAFIGWLNHQLLARLFQLYQRRLVRYVHIFIAMSAILLMGYGWTRRPPFVVPESAVYHLLVYGALVWLFGQLILLILQPLIYIVHRLLKGKRAADPENLGVSTPAMTRREFLHGALAFTPFIAFGIGVNGIYEAQTDMVVQRYSLTMQKLPPNLKGLKIGQLSDTHIGPYFSLARLDTVIQLLAQEKPDLLVITGDFVDNLHLLKPAIERFADLQSTIPYGIYFCWGNHDYFQNAELVRTELNKRQITILENCSQLIVPGQQPFYLMGVDYPWADISHRKVNVSVDRRQQYLAAANQHVPLNAFKVLIAHHPDFLFDGFAAQIPLTLTGHTHGGQVVIGRKPLLTSYAYMRGLFRENGVYGYVSSGAGQWFPFRMGCPPEISIFTLHT